MSDHDHLFEELSINEANGNLEGISSAELDYMQAEVETHFAQILNILRIDHNRDPNSQSTPKRYAKMLVREVCRGRYAPAPKITTFPNTKEIDELVATGPIPLRSLCSHHYCPIIGSVWIGVIPGDRLAGLSKFNRIVDWFAERPQIQEEFTAQVADFIENILQPKGVAVVVKANHTCMTWRGVKADPERALMTTSVMRGVFRDKAATRDEFLRLVVNR